MGSLPTDSPHTTHCTTHHTTTMRVATACLALFLAITVLSVQAQDNKAAKVSHLRAARETDADPEAKKKGKDGRKKKGVKPKKTIAKKEGRKGRVQGRGIVVNGNDCEYITLKDITGNSGCSSGQKFVLKGSSGVRRQFLIVSDNVILAFVVKKKKFTECTAFTDITTSVTCKSIDGLDSVDLSVTAASNSSATNAAATTAAGAAATTAAGAAATTAAGAAATTAAGAAATTAAAAATTAAGAAATTAAGSLSSILNKRVNLTHAAHWAYGFALLINTTTVELTQLYYDGAGPKTNWIVGTKSPIGVDSSTIIIDKLASTGEALYPDPTDLSASVPSLRAYTNSTETLTLPVVNGAQVTWAEVDWVALYCRKVAMLFMSVNIPDTFN